MWKAWGAEECEGKERVKEEECERGVGDENRNEEEYDMSNEDCDR